MFELNLSEVEALNKGAEAKSIEERVSRLEENSRYIIAAIDSMDRSLTSMASTVALLAGQLNGKGGGI